MTADDQDVVVLDNPAAGRYELFVAGRLAGLATYVLADDTMTIPHTEVQPRYEGRGLGARLAKFALDDARRRGLRVVPAARSSPPTSRDTPSTPTWSPADGRGAVCARRRLAGAARSGQATRWADGRRSSNPRSQPPSRAPAA